MNWSNCKISLLIGVELAIFNVFEEEPFTRAEQGAEVI